MPPKDRDIAMVFQNYALYPHMTVRKNMELALRRRKVPREVIRARTRRWWRCSRSATCSTGCRASSRAGSSSASPSAAAIIREPKVFLMDEPLSNLDARLRMETRRELITLQRRLQGRSSTSPTTRTRR